MPIDERELYSGLASLAWSTYIRPGWDHDFYKRIVEQGGGPALEVACGTGRLLIAYRQAGLDVDGCDYSAEMLAVCRARAEALGLRPGLYEQAMQRLDLPRRYQTIYIPCGSLMCVMDPAEALDALRRFRDHLRPGGTLAFNIYLAEHDYSGKTPPGPFPAEWRHHDEVDLADGRRLVIHRRLTGLDPVEQTQTEERRYRLYHDGQLAAEEVRAGGERWYFKHEMLLMLRLAGFGPAQVKGDYTDEDFDSRHRETMVFVARA
jgi:SAM-dependent methyltransferase